MATIALNFSTCIKLGKQFFGNYYHWVSWFWKIREMWSLKQIINPWKSMRNHSKIWGYSGLVMEAMVLLTVVPLKCGFLRGEWLISHSVCKKPFLPLDF